MKYSKLVDIYESLASTTKRLEKTTILADFLKGLSEKDKEILYLLLGRVFPSHSQKELGISDQIAIKILAKASGENSHEIIRLWKSHGDLGDIAEKVLKGKKQTTLHHHDLTTEKVLENLKKLPEIEGAGAIDKKISLVVELFSLASGKEAKYLMRIILEDLRIGIKESTIKEAIAEAFFKENKKEAAKKIEEALEKSNDIAEIFEKSLKGEKHLEETDIQVGKPIKVMLAQKAKTIEEGFEQVGKPCAIEYKYDGFRLLINKNNSGIITMFTRRLENVTKQFPEIVDYVKKHVKGKSFIIDAEGVGYNPKTRKYLPFQAVSQRIKRKYDIEQLQKQLPIELNVFDILYYNGKSLLKNPFKERTKILRKIVSQEKWKIIPAKQIITSSIEKAKKFNNEALKNNQEGIMMKSLEAEYKPGSRVGYMIKIKPSEKEFDLVITGAEYGTGRRGGWLSSFILSCKHYNEFLEIGKVSTGLKEKESEGVSFQELTKLLKPLITEEHGRQVGIKPKIVLTVTYQEIQKSPTYSSGFALRFPRFTALRVDRGINDIASLDQVKDEYEKQRK